MPHKTEVTNMNLSKPNSLIKKNNNNDYKCQGKHTHGDTDLNLPLYQTHSLKKNMMITKPTGKIIRRRLRLVNDNFT